MDIMFRLVSFFSILFFSLNAKEPCKLLVTGCGRSGTNYTAEVLMRSGYDIKHEKPGVHGCVSWPMAVNSYSPWGPMSNDDFEHVFHQVRNPLNVINSWIVNISNLKRDEWQFIRRHVPEIKEDDSVIVSAVKYWIYWNKMADAISEWRYRIEDFKEILPEFMQRAEIEIDLNEFDKIATNFNTWSEITTKLTWEQLKNELPDELYKLLENLSNEYGYAITDEIDAYIKK